MGVRLIAVDSRRLLAPGGYGRSVSGARATVTSMAQHIEQRNLLWGVDVLTRGRVLHVDETHVGFATALALVVQHGRRAREAQEVPQVARCPRCGAVGHTQEAFGVRTLGGKRRPQSWCRRCRSAKAAPRGRLPEEGWLFRDVA